MTLKIESLEEKHSYLLIHSKKKKVFEIRANGSVGYTVKGVYKIANTDKALGVALGQALNFLVKLNEKTLREQGTIS